MFIFNLFKIQTNTLNMFLVGCIFYMYCAKFVEIVTFLQSLLFLKLFFLVNRFALFVESLFFGLLQSACRVSRLFQWSPACVCTLQFPRPVVYVLPIALRDSFLRPL